MIVAYDSARVDLYGGEYSSVGSGIASRGNSVVNIFGGLYDFPAQLQLAGPFYNPGGIGLWAVENSRINVFGTNFTLDGVPLLDGMIPRDGRLTGTLRDGSPLSTLVRGSVFVNPVPEPAAWLHVVVLAACGFCRRRTFSATLR